MVIFFRARAKIRTHVINKSYLCIALTNRELLSFIVFDGQSSLAVIILINTI